MTSAASVYQYILDNYDKLSESQLRRYLQKLEKCSTAIYLHAHNKKYSTQEYQKALGVLN